MKSTNEAAEQIQRIARDDVRIRAVVQRGSRVNPAIAKDEMTPFVFILAVRELETFQDPEEFLDQFGPRILTKSSYDNPLKVEIDYIELRFLLQTGELYHVTLHPVEGFNEFIRADSEVVLLMDKEAIVHPLPMPTDITYRLLKPSKTVFENACIDFFLQMVPVIKGLYRGQILYAIFEHDKAKKMLLDMVCWSIATKSDNRINPGKNGKNLHTYLEDDLWEDLMKIFSTADLNQMWSAAFNTATLFRKFGMEIAETLSYEYPKVEDVLFMRYMREYWEKSPKS